MSQPALVRIVLLASPHGSAPGEGSSPATSRARSADEAAAVAALARLGAEVAVETVESASGASARALEDEVDLIVASADADRREVESLIDRVRHDGPPVLVVLRDGGQEAALGWFRRGASDCVEAGSVEEALPVAALDLIRRQRAVRDRRSAERRIASLRRYTRNIIQNINSALLVVDGYCRVTYANAPAEELLGEPAGGLIGQVATRFFAVEAAADVPLVRTLEKGERFRGDEVVLLRSDGQRLPAAVFCGPMRDEEGRELGAVAIFQDLSEMRQLQRQLFQSEKMASIGQLAAGVAHEINNPVGFIDANLFQMEEYVADLRRLWRRARALGSAAESVLEATTDGADVPAAGLDDLREELRALRAETEEVDADFVLEDLDKAIRESREGSERIRHIVQDLRTFARPDASERVWADVNQCVDSTANIVWSLMKHAVELRKDYGELPALLCHPGQLKQVFMNLLMNAYQAVAARVGDTGTLGEIAITTRLQDGDVVVSVRDGGLGIDPETLSRVFDPFFTTREVGSGMGLGLSTAFHLVSAHGGRIEAESREGEGSTFRVVLPVSAAESGSR